MLRLKTFATLLFGLSATTSALASDWKVDPHAELGLDSTYYPDSLPPTNQYFEQGLLSLPTTVRYKKLLKLKFDPIAQADPLNPSKSERYWVDLPEGYFQVQHSGWTLQAGYNTFTWGVTDGYNPLDVVSARRYQDPLRSMKLGAPSVSLKKDIGKFSAEAIYIPSQRKSVLPGNESRWLPREVFTTRSVGINGGTATLLLPTNLDYFYLPSQQLDAALENNYGFRLQGQGVAPGLDVSLAYFDGAATTPEVGVGASGNVVATYGNDIVIQTNPRVYLSPVYYRNRVYGGSAVYTALDTIFKFEAAITRVISRAPGLPGNAQEFVLGAEHPFPLGNDALTLILQTTFAQHSDPAETTSLNRIFDRSAILAVRYPFSEKLTALGSVLLDTIDHGELAHLEGSYSLTDVWKLGLLGDAFWGPSETPIGVYHKNDRVIATIKALF